jgi:hypothetical protein
LKALIPQAGCRTIAHTFNRQWKSRRLMTVSKTYVADTCRTQWLSTIPADGQRGGICLAHISVRALAAEYRPPTDRTGLSVAEWKSRTVHRHGQAGTGEGIRRGREGIAFGVTGGAHLVQLRPSPRSSPRANPGGSLGRDRCLCRATSDRSGHSQRGNAEGVRLTTEGDKRNSTPMTLSVRIRGSVYSSGGQHLNMDGGQGEFRTDERRKQLTVRRRGVIRQKCGLDSLRQRAPDRRTGQRNSY